MVFHYPTIPDLSEGIKKLLRWIAAYQIYNALRNTSD